MSKYGTLKDDEGNKIYPNPYYKVGDVFITANEENPANRFGGVWERIKGKMLVGVDEDDADISTSGKTGGEKEVTLTVDQIPAHSHGYNNPVSTQSVQAGSYGIKNWTANGQTSETGGGKPHNNMPPFYAVYFWIRVA